MEHLINTQRVKSSTKHGASMGKTTWEYQMNIMDM
jgi:hypothetical protein